MKCTCSIVQAQWKQRIEGNGLRERSLLVFVFVVPKCSTSATSGGLVYLYRIKHLTRCTIPYLARAEKIIGSLYVFTFTSVILRKNPRAWMRMIPSGLRTKEPMTLIGRVYEWKKTNKENNYDFRSIFFKWV